MIQYNHCAGLAGIYSDKSQSLEQSGMKSPHKTGREWNGSPECRKRLPEQTLENPESAEIVCKNDKNKRIAEGNGIGKQCHFHHFSF